MDLWVVVLRVDVVVLDSFGAADVEDIRATTMFPGLRRSLASATSDTVACAACARIIAAAAVEATKTRESSISAFWWGSGGALSGMTLTDSVAS